MTAISEKIVKELPVPATGNKVHFFSGAKLQAKVAPSGFGVRVTAAGTKTFVLFQRVGGRKFLHTIGLWEGCGGKLPVLRAITEAKERVDELADKKADPRPARTQRRRPLAKPADKTVSWLLDSYLAHESAKPKPERLRSLDQITATLQNHVKPAIGSIDIYAIEREDIKNMLNKIAKPTDEKGDPVVDEKGDPVKGRPVMADQALAYTRAAFNWYIAENDKDKNFHSPIGKKMRKTDPRARRRKRTLNESELRDLWAALDIIEGVPACYPYFIKTLLLTGTRRSEAAAMHSSELDGDLWVIPAERVKVKLDHAVPLSATVRDLIASTPGPTTRKNSRFIFSSTEGDKAFSGYSKCKKKLDEAIAKIRAADGRDPMPHWTLHALRKTARSLLSGAVMKMENPDKTITMMRVGPDIAERCIGHVITGIRGTYDWHDYLPETTPAFAALADLVNTIVNPVDRAQ